MNVICADGTRLQCVAFEAIDSGVLLFDEEQAHDEADSGQRATGLVPMTELRYVLPDGVTPGPQPGRQAARPERGSQPVGPAGDAGSRQPRSQSPSGPGGRPAGRSGPSGPGRQR